MKTSYAENCWKWKRKTKFPFAIIAISKERVTTTEQHYVVWIVKVLGFPLLRLAKPYF